MILSKREFQQVLKDAREGDGHAALLLHGHYTYGLNQPEMAVYWTEKAKAGGLIRNFADLPQDEQDAVIKWASGSELLHPGDLNQAHD